MITPGINALLGQLNDTTAYDSSTGAADGGGDAEFELVRTVMEDITRTLNEEVGRLEGRDFSKVTVEPAVFGGSQMGATVAHHHGIAHRVVSETIEGVLQDLITFRDGVTTVMSEADAADLDARQTLARLAETDPSHYLSDSYREQAQNTHVPSGTTSQPAGADESPVAGPEKAGEGQTDQETS